jgi:hypothetical protein
VNSALKNRRQTNNKPGRERIRKEERQSMTNHGHLNQRNGPLAGGDNRKPKRPIIVPALVTFALILVITESSLAGVVVEPPGATVAGKTIGAWSATWWQWAAPLAPPGDPFTDTTGAFANKNQSGPVFFLAGSPIGNNSRHFNVPASTYLLVPLLVGEWSQLELGFNQTAAQIRQAAQQQANQIDSLHATFDGATIPQATLFTHREASPDFSFVAVANNNFGIPAGNSGIAVADGYFLMLDPLTPGTHVLNYGGGATAFGIFLNETDTVTVAPPAAIPLNMKLINNAIVLTWSDPSFHLQAAPAVTGIYTNVPGATSPFTNSITASQSFFRLLVD